MEINVAAFECLLDISCTMYRTVTTEEHTAWPRQCETSPSRLALRRNEPCGMNPRPFEVNTVAAHGHGQLEIVPSVLLQLARGKRGAKSGLTNQAGNPHRHTAFS